MSASVSTACVNKECSDFRCDSSSRGTVGLTCDEMQPPLRYPAESASDCPVFQWGWEIPRTGVRAVQGRTRKGLSRLWIHMLKWAQTSRISCDRAPSPAPPVFPGFSAVVLCCGNARPHFTDCRRIQHIIS